MTTRELADALRRHCPATYDYDHDCAVSAAIAHLEEQARREESPPADAEALAELDEVRVERAALRAARDRALAVIAEWHATHMQASPDEVVEAVKEALEK